MPFVVKPASVKALTVMERGSMNSLFAERRLYDLARREDEYYHRRKFKGNAL